MNNSWCILGFFVFFFFYMYIYTHPVVSKKCGTYYSLLNLLETLSTGILYELLPTHYRTQTYITTMWVVSNVMWYEYIESFPQIYTE
jgi:VanZ family protein